MDTFTASTSDDASVAVGFLLIVIIALSIRVLTKVSENFKPKTYKKDLNEKLDIYLDDLLLSCDVKINENNTVNLLAIPLTKMAWNNAYFLKDSVECGCFDCLEKFQFLDIVDWIYDEPIKTAECPKCSSDCVVGFKSKNEKNDLILKALNHRYV